MAPKSETKAAAGAPTMPVEALLQASGVWSQFPVQFLEAWQRQWNAALRMMDVTMASLARVRDAQVPAMGDGVARAVELQRTLLAAKSPYEAWSSQCNWMLENATRSVGAWKDLCEAAAEANQQMLACLREQTDRRAGEGEQSIAQASVSTPSTSLATQDLVKTALVSVDAAYGQMVRGTQQMMAAATEALNAGLRLRPTPAAAAGAKPAAKRQ